MGQKEGDGVGGKYILIEAPNFNNASDEASAMTSYLRLGAVKDPSIAANPGAPKASGEDLAALVTSFIDDTRKRDGCPDFVPEAERQAETAKLHSKGGWRDHSDGNRVSTTRGDKVEIIKGNYRMLVLGRQNDRAGWDVSGGHVGEDGITFEGSSSIEWVQNYDGTWKVTENTIKGDVFTTYMGDVKDVYSGNIRDSTTGSAAPSKEKPNPVITDRTWALSIASYTGSAALPVPTITDETWAGTISSTTTAQNISDTTTATSITSTTTAGVITDTTTANLVSTTIGNIVDTTIGNTVSLIVGTEAEVVTGNMTEVTLGAEESLTVGLVVDIMVGLMLELTIAGRIELSLGPTLDLSPDAVEMKLTKTGLHVMKSDVSASSNTVSGLRKVLAGQIHLG